MNEVTQIPQFAPQFATYLEILGTSTHLVNPFLGKMLISQRLSENLEL
jgi:hypothetical protein